MFAGPRLFPVPRGRTPDLKNRSLRLLLVSLNLPPAVLGKILCGNALRLVPG
jgi:hypothetical protein